MADCAKGVSNWQLGKVEYPKRLVVDVGESEAYLVAVDIRKVPVPASKVIRGDDPESAPIAVQCALAARLVPVGDSVEVDEKDWVLRKFTPTGVVNWVWSVKTLKPKTQDLRLALQPAVALQGGYGVFDGWSTDTTTTFVTEVDVNASWVQRSGQWWKDNWGVIVLVAGSASAALLALIKWGGDFGQMLRDATAKWRGKRQEDQARSL